MRANGLLGIADVRFSSCALSGAVPRQGKLYGQWGAQRTPDLTERALWLPDHATLLFDADVPAIEAMGIHEKILSREFQTAPLPAAQ